MEMEKRFHRSFPSKDDSLAVIACNSYISYGRGCGSEMHLRSPSTSGFGGLA